ncbi:lycopene cyclase domain-containing protein [Candidatus Saccharibacteria bacterium]|nr:lycopene cyclase domain-containing protein [Candidatus Saccharibacteria bacterium]
MDPQLTYLKWLSIFFFIPIVFLWATSFQLLWRYKRTFIHCIVLSVIFGLTWDYFAVFTHLWDWPTVCCVEQRLPGGVPLEEILFIALAVTLISSSTLIARDVFMNHKKQKARR